MFTITKHHQELLIKALKNGTEIKELDNNKQNPKKNIDVLDIETDVFDEYIVSVHLERIPYGQKPNSSFLGLKNETHNDFDLALLSLDQIQYLHTGFKPLTSGFLHDVLKNAALLLRSLTIGEVDQDYFTEKNQFHPSELPDLAITELTIYANMPEQLFLDLLKKCPNLKTLKLCNAQFFKSNFFDKQEIDFILPRLQTIKLYKTYSDPGFIRFLVNIAPNLSSLSIKQIFFNHVSGYSPVIWEDSKPFLPHLQECDLSCSNLHHLDVHALLESSRELIHVSISHPSHDPNNNSYQLLNTSMPKLNSFNLDLNPYMKQAMLEKILREADAIETLNLSGISIEALDLDGCNWQSLRSLNLQYTRLSQDNIQLLLNAAPHLEKLQLGFGFFDDISLVDLNFSHLAALREVTFFSGASISSIQLCQLAMNAPDLEKLKIFQCRVDDSQSLTIVLEQDEIRQLAYALYEIPSDEASVLENGQIRGALPQLSIFDSRKPVDDEEPFERDEVNASPSKDFAL